MTNQSQLIENLKELIEKYQAFTKWILRHDKDIAKSQRGFDHLMEIDKIEKQIRQLESNPIPEETQFDDNFKGDDNFVNLYGVSSDFMQIRDLTDEEWLKLPKEEILQLYKNCYEMLIGVTSYQPSQSRQTVSDETITEALEKYRKMDVSIPHWIAVKHAKLAFKELLSQSSPNDKAVIAKQAELIELLEKEVHGSNPVWKSIMNLESKLKALQTSNNK